VIPPPDHSTRNPYKDFPSPTADVVNCHDNNDANQQLHQTNLQLSPTLNVNNSASQLLSPQPTADDFVDHTLDKIAQMMKSWLSPMQSTKTLATLHTLPCATPPAPLHLKSSLPMTNLLTMGPNLMKSPTKSNR